MGFNMQPSANDLEKYRGYLKLIAQLQLSPRLRTKEDASDVVQHVMLAACKDINNFRGTTEAELRAWLTRIACNVIAHLGRHYSRRRREIAREVPLAFRLEKSSTILHQSLIGKEAQPGDGLIAQEALEKLLDSLLNLLEDERTAVVLKHFHQWTLAEIAEHIGRTEGAVAGLLRRGLAKLRTQIHPAE